MKTLVLATALLGCQRVALSSPPPAPADAERPQSGLPAAEVVIVSRAGATPLSVEVAADDSSREKGLMFRTSVPDGRGMLFVFSGSEEHTFWMKNTLVPLDMIFIGADQRIVGIVENAAPRTLTPRRVDGPSQYVLEVAGGTAYAHGWRAGDRVELHGVPPAR